MRFGKCKQCGNCCKVLGFWTINSIEIQEWLKTREIKYAVVKDQICILFPKPCKHLINNRCNCYNDRPKVCMLFPIVLSELLPDCGYSFNTNVEDGE